MIYKAYGLEAQDLREVLYHTFEYLREKGVGVRAVSIENENPEHVKTGYSDGRTVFLEEDRRKYGGVAHRLYDVLRLGIGHYFRWNSKSVDTNLTFAGTKAWETAKTDFCGASAHDLKIVEDYDSEASQVMLSILPEILERTSLSKEKREAVLNFYDDYCEADLRSIMTFYAEGRLPPLEEVWQDAMCFVPVDMSNLGPVDTSQKREGLSISVYKQADLLEQEREVALN